MSIYRLTLAWISSENSTTHEECWLILTRLPSLLWTSSHPTGLSAVRYRLSCPSSVVNRRLRVPFPTLWLAFLSYFWSRWDLESKPFVWFRAKTDKGIVCLVDHLHSVTWERIVKSTENISIFWNVIKFWILLLSCLFDIIYCTVYCNLPMQYNKVGGLRGNGMYHN